MAMKLSTKLLLAPGIAITVVLGAAGLNAAQLHHQLQQTQTELQGQAQLLKSLGSQQTALSMLQAQTYRTVALIASLDEAQVKAARAHVTQQAQAIDEVLKTLGTSSLAEHAPLVESLRSTQTAVADYAKQADAAIDMASVDPNTGVAAVQSADASFNKITQALASAMQQLEQVTQARTQAQLTAADQRSLLTAALALLVTAAAATLGWAMQRHSLKGVYRAHQLAQDVAAGDLARPIQADTEDEIGELIGALAVMQARLRDLVSQIRHSAEDIQTASEEVAAGNLDLSSRTEVTASNLQQAAASMDQLTHTVRQSADAAEQANHMATSASEVAARGNTVVHQVVHTMNDIHAASQKISDIIGVIDGIAFQTNILALNAAVEAARAGEQGRGFAVVASEVRSLAQRSAEAAREIKKLIGASVDKVASGTQLVNDAGSTMQEVVSSVQRVSDMINEITAATASQHAGISHINSAVTQLERMTQQNAAQVEQSAAAAAALREQAHQLSSVVGTFQLQAQH